MALNECNHIITLDYLSAFTDNCIQDENGDIKDINLNALPESAQTSGYCPTYSQLTGGSLVQVYSNTAETIYDYTDGIIISGNYDGNQCVKQEDLSLKYIRFDDIIISAPGRDQLCPCSGDVVYCQGGYVHYKTLSDTRHFTTYSKSMSGCTDIGTTTSSADTYLEEDCSGEIEWNVTSGVEGTFSSSTVGSRCVELYAMPFLDNESAATDVRYSYINATTTFRNHTYTSNTVVTVQEELEAGYTHNTGDIEVIDSGINVNALTDQTFDCDGGQFSATAVGYYTYKEYMAWKNSCGTVWDDNRQLERDGHTVYVDLGVMSGEFQSKDCPTIDCSSTSSFTYTWTGDSRVTFDPPLEATILFEQLGTNQCCLCENVGFINGEDTAAFGCDEGTKFLHYSACTKAHDFRLSGITSSISGTFNVTLDTTIKEIKVEPITTPGSSFGTKEFKLEFGDERVPNGTRNCSISAYITVNDTKGSFDVIANVEDCIIDANYVTFKDCDLEININKKQV